jgi:hypothetical protein
MTIKSTLSHCWKSTLWLLLGGVVFCAAARGQATASQATSSVSSGLTHPASPVWGNLSSSGITTNGDWLVQDFAKGALYEFPADGSPMITLLAPGSLGGYQDPGFAIDSNNTLYLEGNWANCVLRFPYDPATKTWPDLASVNTAVSPNNATQNCPADLTIIGGNYPYQYWPADLSSRYVQPKGMVTDQDNNLIVGTYDSGDSWIGRFPITVTNGTAAAGPIQVFLQHASGYTMSIAMDKWNNLYFTENQSANGDFPAPLPGVLMIPAGTMDLQTDIGLTRVDPNLPDVTAVTSDAEGNLYVSDGVKGVVMIPAATSAGSLPQTANSVYLTPDAAQGNVSIDWQRQILYVPTTTTQSDGQADVAKVRLGRLNLGSTAVGTPTAATAVTYTFNGSVTPGSFAIEEAGGSPDFSIASGGTCSTSTTYAAGDSCTVDVLANPAAAGSVSGKLTMLDASSTPVTLATTSLHAIGLGSEVTIGPALETTAGTLDTPSQVAVDASGNSYVADAGLGEVLMFAKGASGAGGGVSVGTGLTAPSGVAVDGAGDVFIADSGNIIEVPYGPGGLNAAGQVTIKTGLGTGVQLAADGLGSLFATDPDHGTVIKLGLAGATSGGLLSPEQDFTGFTAPSAITVDAANNAYIVDNQNLIELPQPTGTQTTVLTSLGAATGLAFDPSGALYATLPSGTVRIPSVGGVLNASSETTIASSVTNPAGVAIDKEGNVAIGDQGAKNLHLVSANGSLSFGTISSSTTQNVSLQNIGNASLTVTGYTSSDAQDFSATGCTSSDVSAGDSCAATVAVNPGPGVQGPISSTITINGNESNAPVAIDATATGTALATPGSATISVASSANVISTPVTVTIAPAAGGATPTGTVTITLDGANPTTATLSGGTVTVALSAIPAGSHTFAVTYAGDRAYASATASTTATVAKAAVTLTVPAFPDYILSQLDGDFPNEAQFQGYLSNYVVTVNGAAGLPPTGTATFNSPSGGCSTSGWNLGTPGPGQATFQPYCLPISTNQTSPNEITPQTITSIAYSGDANYLPITVTTTSAGGPLTFNELRQPSVAISPNPGSLTLSNGTGTTHLSVSSMLGYGVSTNGAYPSSLGTQQLNNYTLPVSFACQGLPAYATCTFTGGNYTDPAGVLHADEFVIDTDPSKPVAVAVTINTNVSTTASNRMPTSPVAFAVLFGFGLIGMAARRRFKDARLLMLACVLTLAGSALGLTSCSSNNFPTESTATVTPPGSYQVSITAQQVGSVVVTGTDGKPLTVYGILNQVSIPYKLNVTVQ